MADVLMPRLSDSMEEGTILQWLKRVGEEVALGEELVEIETDKANMAYEADVAGTLSEIVAQEGETLPIGTVIARIGGDDGDGTAEGRERSAAGPVGAGAPPPPAVAEASSGVGPPPPPPAEERPRSSVAQTAAASGPAAGDGAEGRIKASPLARRLAVERGVDLSSIRGSGPGSRIVKADVERATSGAGSAASPTPTQQVGVGEAAVPAPAAAPVPGGSSVSPETAKGQVTHEDLNKTQQTIARRMAESKATAPHFYLTSEVEMTRAVEARKGLKAQAGEGDVVPSFNDLVVKACAIALREFPKANGAYRDGRFELYSRVNVGVAVAAPGALIVPTVFDADGKGLRQIAIETRSLAAKVREGTITPPELSGATFTVSNLGMYGISEFAAVINSPQAAILAVGAIQERALFKDGVPYPAQLMKLTLACDHRILYGAEGAEFLARVRTLLEEPLGLAL
jgi:pyruvate dehydrogenase E2 component (dihydrolipoamide acetyltransferase)